MWKKIQKLNFIELNANVNTMFISVRWKNEMGGIRRINFSVGTKISRAFNAENKMPKAFPGH